MRQCCLDSVRKWLGWLHCCFISIVTTVLLSWILSGTIIVSQKSDITALSWSDPDPVLINAPQLLSTALLQLQNVLQQPFSTQHSIWPLVCLSFTGCPPSSEITVWKLHVSNFLLFLGEAAPCSERRVDGTRGELERQEGKDHESLCHPTPTQWLVWG